MNPFEQNYIEKNEAVIASMPERISKNKAAAELGRLGGLARAKKVTVEMKKAWGLKGMAKRWEGHIKKPKTV